MTTEVTAHDTFVTLDGLRFHYREWGAPTAPPLILLHGAASHARYWDEVAAALADRLHIVALDQRGFGETDWTPAMTFQHMARDVEQLATHLQLPAFALLGQSMGAVVAWLYAAGHGERVRRLVLVDIGPDVFISPMLAQLPGLSEARAAEAFADPEDAMPGTIAAAGPFPSAAAVRAHTASNLVQGTDGQWRWRYDALGFAQLLRPLLGPAEAATNWERLAQLRCPTLVVRAAQSPVLSRDEAVRMADTIATCRLVEVPNSGHSVNMDNFDGWMEVVRPFLLEETDHA